MVSRTELARAREPGSTVGFVLSWVFPTVLGVALIGWLIVGVNWSFVRDLDFSVVYQYRIALLQGLLNTILTRHAADSRPVLDPFCPASRHRYHDDSI